MESVDDDTHVLQHFDNFSHALATAGAEGVVVAEVEGEDKIVGRCRMRFC